MLEEQSVRFVLFSNLFFILHIPQTHAHQHTAFTALDRYEILYAGYKSDTSVGLRFRCLFLD
jgi:hypothetical protein